MFVRQGKCYGGNQSRVWNTGVQGYSSAIGYPGKAALGKWHLSKDLKEVNE